MSDGFDEQVEVDRFRDHGIESRVHRTRTILGARVARARDRRDPPAFARRQVAHAPDEVVAVLARHADVRDHQVGMPQHERLPRFARRRGRAHVGPASLQRFRQQRAGIGIVVDDQELQVRPRQRAHPHSVILP